MIGLLEGLIIKKELDYLILSVNGIGFKVFMTPKEILKTSENDGTRIYTHMHVREDAITLYGFLSDYTLEFFKKLIGVSGLGPKVALNIINSTSIENLISAIVNEDKEFLKTLPGIGMKSAAKIILELRDKLPDKFEVVDNHQIAEGSIENNNISDAISALINLGYSPREAKDWVKIAASNLNSVDDVNSIVSYVFKNLAGKE